MDFFSRVNNFTDSCCGILSFSRVTNWLRIETETARVKYEVPCPHFAGIFLCSKNRYFTLVHSLNYYATLLLCPTLMLTLRAALSPPSLVQQDSSQQWQVVYSTVWSDTYTPVVILARKQKPLLGGLGKRRLNYSALKLSSLCARPRWLRGLARRFFIGSVAVLTQMKIQQAKIQRPPSTC